MTMPTDLMLTTTQKVVSQKLDELMRQQGVPQATRDAIVNSFEMMYEYIPYAIKQGKNPSDGKVLAEFLAKKGMYMSKFLGSNSVSCGAAIVGLLQSGAAAMEVSASPGGAFLPAPVLAWGLATLDLIEVGNSCEFVQDAYYHTFLRESAYVRGRSEAGVGALGGLP
jgi:hypothetical protein